MHFQFNIDPEVRAKAKSGYDQSTIENRLNDLRHLLSITKEDEASRAKIQDEILFLQQLNIVEYGRS